MKYLILILTLLFSFNVKAESYSCSHQISRGLVSSFFERIDSSTFNLTINNYLTDEPFTQEFTIDYEDDNWLKLSNMRTTPTFFDGVIYVIQKTGTIFQRISIIEGVAPSSTWRGTCLLIR